MNDDAHRRVTSEHPIRRWPRARRRHVCGAELWWWFTCAIPDSDTFADSTGTTADHHAISDTLTITDTEPDAVHSIAARRVQYLYRAFSHRRFLWNGHGGLQRPDV